MASTKTGSENGNFKTLNAEILDSIEINGIRAAGKIGVTEAEREQAQTLEINLELQADLRLAAQSDELLDTIDYSALHKVVVRTVENGSRKLLEKLAHEILETIFTDRKIRTATVSIAKPQKLKGATPLVRLKRINPNS